VNRYDSLFDRLSASREGALGAFVMLGDPDLPGSAHLLDRLVDGGADMIEVGIPFSDPVADGPVIQAAAQRALAAGVKVGDCLELIAGFRKRHPAVPLGILTYANIVVARGREQFFGRAADCGADSLLVADLPAREAGPWADEMHVAGLEPVLIAASNSPPETLRTVARIGSGYTYCVTRAGITGTHAEASFHHALLRQLRDAGAPPPVFGFGISSSDQVRAAMRAGAAGVISGSAIVACAAEGGDVVGLVRQLKSATRNDSAA
jgi:tryptophan synthase alpha chain